MQLKRVVITGIGAVSPLGPNVDSLMSGIRAGTSGVKQMEAWKSIKGLRSLVAAPSLLENEKAIPRQARRSMGRLSIFAVQAAEQAIADAKISAADLKSGRLGCIIGSTTGSPESLNEAFATILTTNDIAQLTSTKFFQCVSHTAAMNVAQYLGITGAVMATSAACASSLQAVGAGYDLIRLGTQDVVVCGGAEEVHHTVTGTFDVLFATSEKYNQTPQLTPRPFDKARDGLVCGDGSGIVILEDYERAVKRGAHIYAEVTGFCTCGNGAHVSQPSRDAMVHCMRTALDGAGIAPGDVDFVSAHATATLQGDVEEAAALRQVFGKGPSVNSLKGYIGHTLGASGTIELAACLKMMEEGVIYPTLNLTDIDPECAGIDHVLAAVKRNVKTLVKNCFAFGGINASLVCRKLDTE